MKPNYRAEIDGLRSMAVVPVVMYHAGIPIFSGGFVGVDVFFVISGFLITAIILREVEEESFSLLGFYERRVRRILPALFALLAFVILMSLAIMLPSEIRSLPITVFGALLFASNIVFWRQEDYFAPQAETLPLLHTWSLGIEEQFYIFMPLAIMFLHKNNIISVRAALWALTLISFALCAFLTPVTPQSSFYLLPMRAWELLAGALCATGAIPQVQGIAKRNALASLGIVFILAAAVLFDKDTLFPGMAALLPVGGSLLIIQYAQRTQVARVLSMKAFVFIGLISYSLYLWHWPMLVFARMAGLLETGLAGAIGVVAASFGVAVLSWRFVEQPFRSSSKFNRRQIFIMSSAAAAVLAVSTTGVMLGDGWPSRLPASVVAYDDARRDITPMRSRCHRTGGLSPPERSCTFGNEPATLAVWGDSHGGEISYAMASQARAIISITYSACPPAAGFEYRNRPLCDEHNAQVLRYLSQNQDLQTIVLAARWQHWVRESTFPDALERTIAHLRQSGKRVILLGPVPAPGDDVPTRLARGGSPTFSQSAFETGSGREMALLRRLERGGVDVFWPHDVLCDFGLCRLTINGRPILFDDNHLSMQGAYYVAQALTRHLATEERMERDGAPTRAPGNRADPR